MKNKIIVFLILLLFSSIIIISCKTTPEETPAPVEQTTTPSTPSTPATPSQVDSGSLNRAAERAAAARKLGSDFNANDYFPAEWDSANTLYSQAESQRSTATQAEANASADRYNSAADALEAVALRAIEKYADDQEAELLYKRDRAIQAGAEELVPDYLLAADNKVMDLLAAYEAGDYYAANDLLAEAKDMYETLELGLAVYHLRMDIEDRGFASYDPSSISAIDDLGLSAIDDYQNGDSRSAHEKAQAAMNQYMDFRNEWMEIYTVDAARRAGEERQKALDLKANIAARFDYDTADSLYSRAQGSHRAQRFEEAADQYDRSRLLFAAASQLTMEKRTLAEDALREADMRMSESDQTVQRAEAIIEGGL